MKKVMLLVVVLSLAYLLYADPCVQKPVLDPNQVPFHYESLAMPDSWFQINKGGEFYRVYKVCDPDGDPVTVEMTSAPVGATIDVTRNVVRWKPTADQYGVFYFVFTATDTPPAGETALSSRACWVVNVKRGNFAPFIVD